METENETNSKVGSPFRPMRRKDRELSPSEAEELLKTGEYGVLSTAGEDGYPYGVPVNYVFLDGVLYFHCAAEGEKLDALARCGRVSFCVVGETDLMPEKFSTRYESVIAFGTADEAAGEEKREALMGLIRKYSPGYLEKGKEYVGRAFDDVKIIRIRVDHLTGKARR